MGNWDDYQLILALSRSDSLRGAAKMMGVNHSTISRRLAALNAGKDGPVFEQYADGYRPTGNGAHMIGAAERMESLILEAQRQKRTGGTADRGSITLSLPESIGQYLLSDALAGFCREYPAIELTILSSYGFANLDRSEADIVIRGTKQPPDHLVGRRLFPYALSYYCRHDYLENTPFEQRRWLAPAQSWGDTDWQAASPYPDIPELYAMEDVSMRHQALLAGHGMARGACFMADQEPELMRLPGAKVISSLDLWVLTHPDLKQTPRIKTLMRFLCDALLSKRSLIEGQEPQTSR